MTGSPGTASGVPPTNGPSRPSIAERAARRDELQATGRDRYGTLLRSLQAGHELPLHRRGGRIAIDWNPILWTLFKVAIVVVAVYFTVRVGTQWWRENHVDTWSGPDATVQSGVSLAGCPVVADIRVEDFPSWVSYGGSIYNYTPWKRPYINAQTPGYTMTPYSERDDAPGYHREHAGRRRARHDHDLAGGRPRRRRVRAGPRLRGTVDLPHGS